MIQSKLFNVEELNNEKRNYLHDYKPIICEKNKLVQYWESLSLYEKEKIFIVYDLNLIDELVEILNIARSRIATTEFDRKSGQIIKMPEKRVLLEYLYFDALGIYFNEDLFMKKFVRSLCLINNKVNKGTNDIHEKYLEEQKLPECTDFQLISGKKKVLKFKIRSLLSILDNLEVVVDKFCNGEKVLLRKRHYSTLYSQLVKNPLPKSPSSEEIKAKIKEIFSLLSIMLENNLIKSYNKANKYYQSVKKESTKASGSARTSLQTSFTPSFPEKQKTELIVKEGDTSQQDLTSQNEELNNKKRTSLRIGSNKQVQKSDILSNECCSSNKLEQNYQIQPELNQPKQENLAKRQEQLLQKDKIDLKDKLDQKDKQELNDQIGEIEIEEINIQNIGDNQAENTNINQNQEQNENVITQTDQQIYIENQEYQNNNHNGIEIIPNITKIENEISNENDQNINKNILNKPESNLTQITDINQNTTDTKQDKPNKIHNDHDEQDKQENNLSMNEMLQLQERQKLECLMEIEKDFEEQFENEDEDMDSNNFQQYSDAKYSQDIYKINLQDNDNIGSTTSSPGYAKLSQDDNNDEDLEDKKKKLIKKYCKSDIEQINKKLCIVNVNSLIIKIDLDNDEDHDSIFDSDEEYYQPDEKENFHYNQDFKDYDIVDVLGENFKFDPNFSLSKEKINQLLQQQQQYQYHGNMPIQQTSHTSSNNKKLNPMYNQVNPIYNQSSPQIPDQKSIYSDESSDETYDNKGNQYLGMNVNQGYQKSRQQQNYYKQDQQMLNNMPYQQFNPQFNQFHYLMLLNQNMMMNHPHNQMPPQGKFKNSSKYQRSHHQTSNPMNGTGANSNASINNNSQVIYNNSTSNSNTSMINANSHISTNKNISKNGNPNNIKSKNSTQSTHDNQYNVQQSNNNISSSSTNYINSNKGVKNVSNNSNNSNGNSNTNNNFTNQQSNSSSSQGSSNYRKKRFNNKGSNK